MEKSKLVQALRKIGRVALLPVLAGGLAHAAYAQSNTSTDPFIDNPDYVAAEQNPNMKGIGNWNLGTDYAENILLDAAALWEGQFDISRKDGQYNVSGQRGPISLGDPVYLDLVNHASVNGVVSNSSAQAIYNWSIKSQYELRNKSKNGGSN